MTDLPSNVRWQLWIVAFGFYAVAGYYHRQPASPPLNGKKLGRALFMHVVIVSYVLTVAVMLLPAAGVWTKWGCAISSSPLSCCLPPGFAVLRDGEYAGSARVMARVLQGVGPEP